MSTKGRENWEKYKAGYVSTRLAEEVSTGNAGRDSWNELKKTIRFDKPESTQDVVSGSGAQKDKKFDAGQYAEDAGKLFLNGVAEGVAATGAAVENWIGKGLDKLFPGAGFEGSGLFNVLYNGRPDWKWAGENGLVGIKQDREYNQGSLQKNAERIDGKVMKKAAEFGGDIAYGLGNAAPMAATAMVTGGASAAAAITKEGLLKTGAEVVEKSGVLNSMSQAARDMLTSRDYWMSFASEVGMDYYDALDSGATEDEALRYALSSAGLNSVIEVGGGIQKIPEKPTFRTWLKSAHEEGMEEIQQGIVSRLLENVVYNKGNPIASVTDENAVLNPVTALGEYAGGAAVGGILSGGQQLTQRGINNAQYKRAYGTSAQDLVKESLEMNPDNALATKLQKKLEAGKKLTGSELRQLVEQNEIDMVDGDRATIQTAAEARLTELGETENVPQVAEAIARQAAGEAITADEKTLLEGSERARQVRQELNPENIRVGATDEAWTGQIGTARVNRAAYNRGIQENGVTGAKYNAETGKLDAIVKDDAGKIETVPAEQAELSPLQEELFDWAADLGEAGPVLVSAYRQTQNLETYARQFHNAYEYGKAGVPMDYVNKSQAVSHLNETQREIAYEEGAKAHQRELKGRQEKKRSGGTVDSTTQKKPAVSLRGATVGGVKYAAVNKKAMDGRQWASVGTMKAFAQATGVNVVFYESQANERGEYEGANGFYKNGTLYLDINAGRDRVAMGETAILKTAAHEITHYIKEGSPEQYEVLKNFVVEKLTREKGISFDDLVTDKQRREPGLSYEEAVDEVVADACEMMLKDSKAVEQMARENRSLAERIRQWIRKWVRSLKAAMEGLTADRPESRAMMQYAQELQEIWDNALVEAARNGRGAVQENAPAEVKRQVRENFSNEIDGWAKDEMPEGVRFTLGSTGPVLQGLGAIESDIYMEGDKIKKIMQDHPEMTLAEIKKVPQILEDPALILKSEGRGKSGANSRLVCFGLTKAQNGQPVMTVMDLRPRENGFVVDDMQKVNSAYTKNNPMAFIHKSDVVYADKKRAIPLLRTTGLTISSQRLLRNGYIGSISYKGSSVNIEGVPFSSVVKMEANDKAQNQQRDNRLSDRAVLEWAAEMALRDKSKSWTAEDREQLERFRNRMRMLQDTQAELEALKEERKVLLAGRKVSEITGEERTELTQNKNRIDIAKGKAERYEAAVWELESKAAIKTLLRKSRSIVETEASNQARKEYREKQEEREMVNVTRRKVERNAKRLLEYMNTNTDKKHIPEALKKPIGELLESLNFYSNSARRGGYTSRADLKYYEAMQGLQAALATQRAFDDTGEGTDVFKGYLDLPAGFESLLAVHVQRVKDVVEKHPLKTDVLKMMDLGDLRDLDVILSVMSRSVTKMNEMFIKRRFAYVADAAEDSIFAMQRLGQHQDKPGERFALWDNTLPWYAFQRFGEGGKAVFEGLQDGWDKLAFNMKTILDFRQGLISDALARKWDTETHKVELNEPDGSAVTATLTTAQLMSLYCLSKRKQALGHLLGGGIRPDAIEIANTLGDKIKKKKWKQDKQFKLTEESLGQLSKLLTPEQIKVADAMQKFMTEQGSTWGNAISMERFGYRAFTEQNYFPIETDRQDREAKTGDAKEGSLYRLQNISAVKPLVKNANNALILRGIFDVFANHTADMAKYNALVLPIIDAQKWYNYRYGEKNEAGQVYTRTVQRAMTKAYGEVANNFVVTFLRDLNGVKESSDRGTSKAERATSFYKRTAVAANLRVALLQPTAYVRASLALDYKYLAKAFADKTGTKQATKEMMENSGIALWKSLGFFDTDVGRSIRDQIKGKSSKIDDLVDKTMVPAEKGDEVTWARLWRACKLEVQDKQHLTGEKLLNATAERFREVIYRTQVVDSTMTRSHNMRAGSEWAKTVTAFMSEPTVSYNMVMESTRKTAEDAKRMGMRVAVKRNGKILVRAFQAYVLTEVASAIIESLTDAFRDPDDDPFLEKFWTAFWGEKPESFRDAVLGIVLGTNGNLVGNLNLLGKIPLLKDALSALSGDDVSRMDMEALTNTYKALAIWDETIRLENGSLDKATKTTYYGNMTTYGKLYQTSKALSQLSGLPISSTMREAITVWNNTVGAAWPAMKMRTYEDKKLREAWQKYGKDSGVSYATVYRAIQDMKEFESDRDADGNAISGSLKAKYVDYIKGLGLNRAQGKAVWEAAKNPLWSDKDTPWG